MKDLDMNAALTVLSSDSTSDEILIQARHDKAKQDDARKAFHDYQAAIRTLKYLAQKALDDADPELQSKQQSLQKHFRNLESFQKNYIQPLMAPIVARP